MSDQPPSPTGGIVPPYISDKLKPKPKQPRRIQPTDVVAIIIAASLAINATIVVVVALSTHSHLADGAVAAMGDIGKVLAGALAAYLGIRYYEQKGP